LFGTVLKPAGLGVSDYTDWLVAGTEENRAVTLRTMVRSICERHDWVGLEHPGLRNEDDARFLASTIRDLGFEASIEPSLACPYTSMPQGFSTYLQTRPSRLRYNVRSREKRLRSLGDLRYQHAGAEDLPRLMEVTIHLHGRRWQGQHTSTVFSSSHAGRAFYRVAMMSAVQQGYGDLALLTLNEHVVAAAIGFQHGHEYHYYLPAWNPGYHLYAPSTLLLVHLMDAASQHGMTEFDFMLGDEPYKSAWATSHRRVFTLLAAPPTPQGRAWFTTRRSALRLRDQARTSRYLRTLRRFGVRGLFQAPGSQEG
jgi:CelD/BcsL family acetyltransferase involved in cellulose biosynthesis